MGSIVSRVADNAGILVQIRGGLELIRSSDAQTFLEACQAVGCEVLGAEGFHLVDGDVEPDTDAILDLSQLDNTAESVAEAKRFVAKVADEVTAFDFTLTDPRPADR